MPGTQYTTSADEREICMGDKDADPAAGVDVAAVGDCLRTTGEAAERTACDTPEATSRVLARFEDVPSFQASAHPGSLLRPELTSPCDAVGGWSGATYSWNLESIGGPARSTR